MLHARKSERQGLGREVLAEPQSYDTGVPTASEVRQPEAP